MTKIVLLATLLLLTFSCAGQNAAPVAPVAPLDRAAAIAALPVAVIDAEFSDSARLCIATTPSMKFFSPNSPRVYCGETIGELRRRLSHTVIAD